MTNYVEEMMQKVLEEVTERLNMVDKKVENIEYKDIKSLEEKLHNIEVKQAEWNVLTKQNTEAMRSISDTMNNVCNTMIKLSSSVDCISKTNEELTNNLKQQNVKIDNLQTNQDKYVKDVETMKKEIRENEEKGKFDIMLFIKNNFVNIIMGTGFLIYFLTK